MSCCIVLSSLARHAAILTITCPSLGNIPGSKECSRAAYFKACLLGRGITDSEIAHSNFDDNGLASYGKRSIDHGCRVVTFTSAQAIQMAVSGDSITGTTMTCRLVWPVANEPVTNERTVSLGRSLTWGGPLRIHNKHLTESAGIETGPPR
jgi:hypothetical protein